MRIIYGVVTGYITKPNNNFPMSIYSLLTVDNTIFNTNIIGKKCTCCGGTWARIHERS